MQRFPRAIASSSPVGGYHGALGSTGVNIDEANEHIWEGFSALCIHGVSNEPRAVGQMTSIAANEAAMQLNVLDRIIVVVSQRQRHEGFGSQTAPAP